MDRKTVYDGESMVLFMHAKMRMEMYGTFHADFYKNNMNLIPSIARAFTLL